MAYLIKSIQIYAIQNRPLDKLYYVIVNFVSFKKFPYWKITFTFGTLWNTEKPHKRNAIRDILIELDVGQPDLELITDKAFSEFKKNLSHAYRELQVRSCHGAEDVFFRLRSRGIKVVLNTGYNREMAQLLVDKLGWQMGTDFDLLVTASDVENSRPSPDMIHFAMEKLAITEASSVMKIGDSAIDILEGKNAGCRLNIGITSGAQTREQLEQAEPDAIIDRLEELFQWID